ncbi:MAG: hypothetical protein ACI9LZ_004018 [Glaciecola sp.]|jgi:hypothetical protein
MRILPYILAAVIAIPAFADPQRWAAEWPNTDFDRSAIEFTTVLDGGPARDGILAIDQPQMMPVERAAGLSENEAVITVEIDGQPPRAYPLRYLTWHEIVNDEIAGLPIAVTFCPLCNSAMVFDRRVEGQVLSFGVSGKLRNSDMIMYDRETESWWQQAVGEGIVGQHMGTELVQLPSWMESWAVFRDRNPDGLVMAEPAFNRPYGRNPYTRYDTSTRPFLYDGELPPHGIPALARVVRVGDRAWPLSRFTDSEQISEAGVTLSWASGLASALDSDDIGAGRDVGAIRVRDATGADIAHDVMFAFAYHAFWPDGEWMLGR